MSKSKILLYFCPHHFPTTGIVPAIDQENENIEQTPLQLYELWSARRDCTGVLFLMF